MDQIKKNICRKRKSTVKMLQIKCHTELVTGFVPSQHLRVPGSTVCEF